VYGSANGGKTVHCDHMEINQKMDEAAQILNLKKHYVNKKVQLSAPGDLEGIILLNSVAFNFIHNLS